MYLSGQLTIFYRYVATFVGEVVTISGYKTTFGGTLLRHFKKLNKLGLLCRKE
jgi:hypothetical protein